MQFLVGPDKVSATTRYDRGVKVGNQAPQSALYTKYADMKSSADALVQENVQLKTAMDAHSTAAAAYQTTRTALALVMGQWDGAYDVFVKTGEKYAMTDNDVAGLGGTPRAKTHNPLAVPLGVDVKYDPKLDRLRIRVLRAPGMRTCIVQVSPDPVTATSWVEQSGNGAIHLVQSPAKGTWWVRAASRTAKGTSDFTAPTSVIVK
jgi:hypothetical protein